MAISKRGTYEAPTKSPYNFERYDSDLERMMMEKLEADAKVAKWQKRHGVFDSMDRHARAQVQLSS